MESTSVRTERNWSPHTIWVNGMTDPVRIKEPNSHLRCGEWSINIGDGRVRDHGEGPLPDEQTHTVDVPETLCHLSDSSV